MEMGSRCANTPHTWTLRHISYWLREWQCLGYSHRFYPHHDGKSMRLSAAHRSERPKGSCCQCTALPDAHKLPQTLVISLFPVVPPCNLRLPQPYAYHTAQTILTKCHTSQYPTAYEAHSARQRHPITQKGSRLVLDRHSETLDWHADPWPRGHGFVRVLSKSLSIHRVHPRVKKSARPSPAWPRTPHNSFKAQNITQHSLQVIKPSLQLFPLRSINSGRTHSHTPYPLSPTY
ncbi:hypothetical protein BU24DRAFT_109572 [Aaosphaeria arxii CBS 175.79]|uniref:Uncharacterized protein n=1 Tax=Aaosphaeria arxii CBS 175.79 TaxID=1450172 RepID=A0A6A5Y159_9PLEO|nr:uncharacterized protein BU24DRAFT_109572 [Aaosphaeria arxii CBS 175.79]KAF2018976.1 hypothetical protein BU24DRAFT_109572 [Aaosphaeria arxii CBS 175.79]